MLNNELFILAQTLFMNLFYNLTIYLTSFILKVLSLFNTKIKKGVIGRAETFQKLNNSISQSDKTFWFHCASLGEYEQGLPVFNKLRDLYPTHKIVLSFFSPSGYEIRKNNPFTDVVVYLPLDTKANAKLFIDIVNPELTVFVKYEIWPNYLNEIKNRGLKAILISATFRKEQAFFKWYGVLTKKSLFSFDHIFTQNENSKKLLESINYKNASISGDTRFDRVFNQLKINNSLPFIEEFKDNKLCVVVGSSWPDDESLLVNYINKYKGQSIKFIIAPHNIKTKQIEKLKSSITKNTILFSEKERQKLEQYDVLIIDTIGLLNKIYSYANIAYVGGAMGDTGLHNILEPAVFGVPIIIGKNYNKFPEAYDMIAKEGVFSIQNESELTRVINRFIEDDEFRKITGNNNFEFINQNKGALNKITAYLSI